jgi:hypothetical protein
MALKKLEILVPEDAVVAIDSFTPEENYIMLKMGSCYLFEGQNVGAGLTHKEICQNIGDKSWEKIGQPPQHIFRENVSAKAEMEHERQIRKLETQVRELRHELMKYGVASPR